MTDLRRARKWWKGWNYEVREKREERREKPVVARGTEECRE